MQPFCLFLLEYHFNLIRVRLENTSILCQESVALSWMARLTGCEPDNVDWAKSCIVYY